MKEQPPKMKTVALYIILLIIFLTAFVNIATTKRVETIKYSEFVRMLRDKDSSRKVINVKINDREITGQMVTRNLLSGDKEMVPAQFRTVIPEDPGLMEILRETPNITIDVEPPAQVSWWLNLLINIFPFILLFGAWVYILQKMQGGGAKALSFGKSRARMVDSAEKRVLFKDVAGVDEAKQDLEEVVEFLKEPAKFTSLGAKIPRGVLLYGPPGTGKTLLARAVAGEANVPFFNISGSEFVEMFVGVGASRVRDLFEQARKNAPCIVFMDEIDAVGRQRGAGLGGGHDEREQTLNQLLVEMDGFDNTKGIILVAATNRPDVLDPALLRPGRFDRRIVVDQPDIVGREQILKIHVRDKPIADDVNLQVLARRTPGFVGADLANLANEAAILAARHNRKVVRMSDFEEAIDRVIAGSERKSRIISEREKTTTAVHEMGHALVAASLPGTDPVHKITIIPRGRAGGYVMSLPDEDVFLKSKEQFEDEICAAMGGRAAEEIVFNQFTTGASADLQAVTQRARAMITQFGMSEVLGPRTFGGGSGSLFLGRDIYEQRDYSEHAAEEIDKEVRRIVQTAYDRAKALLIQHRSKLDLLARVLIEQETLDRQMFEDLMNGIIPPAVSDALAGAGEPSSGAAPGMSAPAPARFSDLADDQQ